MEHEIYLGAKQLLSSKDKWTKEAYARNSQGKVTSAIDPNAVCFCLVGAIQKITKNYYVTSATITTLVNIVNKQIIKVKPLSRLSSLSNFNDSEDTTYEDVIRVLDEAIAATKPT